MADSIDRRAAIDALCDSCETVDSSCAHYPCKRYLAIEDLPSAQPQKVCVAEVKVEIDDIKDYIDKAINAERWIPCSERLPKPFEYCLWTTTDGRVVYHHCDGLFSNYVAWMPLPEPYKEEQE